jgi:putative ABC transport system permease protein
VRDVDIAAGRYFNATELDRTSKVAVLGASLAQELFGQADGTLIDPIGQRITVGTTKLTIIGVADEKGVVGNTDFDAQLYVPISIVFEKFIPSQFARFVGDRVRLIYAQIDEEADMEEVITQIELKLATSKDITVAELPFTIQTQNDIIETQGATTAAFRSLLAWVAGVSLLVGGIGIMNIMLVSVTERTKEIGIRKALGAKPRYILTQFLLEAVILCNIGGIIGVGVGFGLGNLVTAFTPFGVSVPMEWAVIGLVFCSAVGIGFGLLPAIRASRLNPIDALRYE